MLVLSRRESERIRLGKSIVVTVVRVSGDKVRLGIEAPPDVLVLREELEPHVPPEPVGGRDSVASVTARLDRRRRRRLSGQSWRSWVLFPGTFFYSRCGRQSVGDKAFGTHGDLGGAGL